jgi:magnesium transporter
MKKHGVPSHRKDIHNGQALRHLSPVEIVDFLVHLPPKKQLEIFTRLPPELGVKTFEFLPFPIQRSLLQSLMPEKAAYVLKKMAPDDRTAFLEELPRTVANELLKLLPVEEKALAIKLLGYPENSVGRLMTTDYIAVRPHWTVKQALDHIRRFGHDSETINVIYVTDNQGKLMDDLRVRELLFASPEKAVKDIADHQYVYLLVNDQDEQAINVFLSNDRVALPVIDDRGLLLGIVTIDDILNLVKEEDTEDIQKIGGTEALEEPYMDTPFLELMKKRAGWLTLLFLGETLTASAMGYFEDEISKAVILALFVPLIISSGGNSGSQASTLIIRALAIGEVTVKDWWKIMKREIYSGLFLGIVLGTIGFMRIGLWSAFSDIYGPHWQYLAITVSVSLIGVVLWGSLSGAMLPLLLKKLKFDPAVSSAPLVATLVDVTGLVIYFGLASLIMQGILL